MRTKEEVVLLFISVKQHWVPRTKWRQEKNTKRDERSKRRDNSCTMTQTYLSLFKSCVKGVKAFYSCSEYRENVSIGRKFVGPLKSSLVDQDPLTECDQMRFIFQHLVFLAVHIFLPSVLQYLDRIGPKSHQQQNDVIV